MSYHDDLETLDSLKAWWARWGNTVTWAVLAVVVAGAAWSGWNYWQRRSSVEAALLYDQLAQTLSTPKPDSARIERIASDMTEKFARTAYAPMTAMVAARVLVDTDKIAAAQKQLQWVIDHAHDDGFVQVARIRLAGLLLDAKQYDAALKLVAQGGTDPFANLRADRRGDIYAAQGKTDAARDAYRAALKGLGTNDAAMRQLIQYKLDGLGG